MTKYYVNIPWFASLHVTVEANSVKEAMEKALEEAYPSLCHQCSGGINLDGGPDDDHFTEDCVDEAAKSEETK